MYSSWAVLIFLLLMAVCWRHIWRGKLENGVLITTQPIQTSISGQAIDRTESSSFLPPPYWPKFGGDRHVELLDGIWRSAAIPNGNDLDSFDSMSPGFDPSTISFDGMASIPSCIDRSPPGYMEDRGVFFFQRRFRFDLTAAGARVQFQACSFYCRVWVNGVEIGDHLAGGYVAFFLDIPAQPTVDNEIIVLVDNRFNTTTAPMHTGGDFFHYGGMMRSVELHALPPSKATSDDVEKDMLWPWRLYVIPESLESIQVTLYLTSAQYTGPVDSTIKISFDDGPYSEYPAGEFEAVDGVANLGVLTVPNPRVWSTTDPQLHTIAVEMDGAILIERFGLRIFDIDNDSLRFRLNGEIVKLVGWGHHTQWPDTAGSPTQEQLEDDVLLLLAGGANFVRGAHYPQDPRWLDLLDENGLVMWCETLGPGVSLDDTQDPYFLRYQAQQMGEMLDNAMNHASIAFWAYFNEGPSRWPLACDAYRMNTDIIKARDNSRLVSFASCHAPPIDVCYPFVDVVAINGYPGWYDAPSARDYWGNFASFYRNIGKPFLISETGAGAIYEWRNNETAVPWTCPYQTQVLIQDVEESISNPNISGVALWHFFDFKTTDEWENNTHCDFLPSVYPPTCGYIEVNLTTKFQKPGGQNCKGVVDFWRRTKPSFKEVALRFSNVTNHLLVPQLPSSSVAPPPYWPKFGGDRHVEVLDGIWRSATIPNGDDLASFDSMSPDFDPSTVLFDENVSIPSCVDRSPPGYMRDRGVFFFQRRFHFDLTESGARVQFQACSFYCRVWVNGIEIGDHLAGGYVAFFLDIPAQPTVDNEIIVLVDNRFNKTTAPVHTGGDFFHYGGIMRSVELHALPPSKATSDDVEKDMLWPWRLYVIPESLESIQVTLYLTSAHFTGPVDSTIKISFDDGPYTEHPAGEFGAVDGVANLGVLKVPNPRVWSTTDPQLHTIAIEMDGAILIERFGLRTFDIDNDSLRFRLNGEIVKLVGWGHHTQWPDTAGSPTQEQLEDDVLLLLAGGANFVRGAHYPQDPRWLDLLDENGLVMWCETLGPDVSIADTQDSYFLRYQAQQMREMLDNAMNHASIAFWGYFNEGPSQSSLACDAYRMNTDIIKARDNSRLVSYASDQLPPKDKCFQNSVDIVAVNGYPSWYIDANPISYWNRVANFYHSVGKAFLISESGAGGIYEWDKNQTSGRWTCSYQTQVLSEDVEVALSNPNISGVALWHFFDFKVNDAFENNTHCDFVEPSVYPPKCAYINATSRRPGGKNHKGVVDFWRRKKPSFEEVSKRFSNVSTTGVDLVEPEVSRA
eukprot:scaffold119_cov131-Cylindrotheca_fusiformis.AAC.4